MTISACRRRTTCRLCDGSDLTVVLELTPTPPANAFVPEEKLYEPQVAFPLDLFLCNDCGHVQLLDIVDPEILFADYVYVSGTSPVFVQHFKDYAATVTEKYLTGPKGGLAFDIGSNDATLLKQFKALDMQVLGVDPACDIAAEANANGIETLATFFTSALAADIRRTRGAAQVITANNVYAHADDLGDITDGIRMLLAPDGVFIFEVSYLVDVFEKTLFDTVYHEHLAYHTVKPLVGFFATHGMELIAAERISPHGGSLRGVAQLKSGQRAVESSVGERVAHEKTLGLDRRETLLTFGDRINGVKKQLTALLNKLKAEGQTIAAFGAPAKATTLMYHFGIGPKMIDFIVDDSPLKQGLFSPGMHIPILPSEAMYSKSPDAIVILAWNFAKPIMRNHAHYLEQGGRFIVPLPNVEIFD